MIRLPYGSTYTAVPSRAGAHLDVAQPPRARVATPLDPAAVERALDSPFRGPVLREALGRARSALVVVSDGTRSTGADRFLPPLLARLQGAGVRRTRLAVASGLHRRPGARDVARIVGEPVAATHEVLLHDPDDPGRLVRVGRTSAGTEVLVHRAVLEHDAVILTGSVGFHYYAGFSGGRKALVPGLAGRTTIASNHLRALRRDGSRHPDARAARLAGNPVHRDMVESAAMLQPAWLVNTVMGDDGGIERLFVGHWRRAHEAACRYVRATRTVRLEARPLVVVSAGGRPHDIDLIQAHKALEAAMGALTPGGTVVLLAACPLGLGHEDFLRYFAWERLDEHVSALVSEFRVYGQTALSWRRKLERCRVILVSELDPDLVRRIGAVPASDLTNALAIAEGDLPRGARGWVLPHGARWWIEPHSPGGSAR